MNSSEGMSTFLCCGLPIGIVVVVLVLQYKMAKAAEAELKAQGSARAIVGTQLALLDRPLRIASKMGPNNWKTVTLSGTSSVSVESAGSVTAVRGRNLAAKAGAGALTFGVGSYLWEMLRRKRSILVNYM